MPEVKFPAFFCQSLLLKTTPNPQIINLLHTSHNQSFYSLNLNC